MTIVGTRPQLIKCAALSPALHPFFEEVIVHTGQHYDNSLSENLIQELKLSKPDYNLDVSGGSGLSQISRMMLELEPVIMKENPDLILVFGDTNSTAAGAIAATKCKIKFAHIEAGMREFDKSIPEESNKLITSILADYHFCATSSAVQWLSQMGIKESVYLSGDVMLDLIDQRSKEILQNEGLLKKLNIKPGQYAFVTVHRASNTDNEENLREIIEAIDETQIDVIFPLHPRTRDALSRYRILIREDRIKLMEPLGWLDTQTLIKFASYVITDSGGVTKEAFHHKTPGILVDKQTEWIETVEQGWNHQAGPDKKKILKAIKELKIPNFHRGYNQPEGASSFIAKTLHELVDQ